MRKRIGIVVAVLVVVGLVVFAFHRSPTASPTSSTSQPAGAIWPFASTPLRFENPQSAARSFASAYVGFTSPDVGSFTSLGSGYGDVRVTPQGSGPATTVFVRRLTAGRTWWITGANASTIVVTTPTPSSVVSSRFYVRGRSTAYEAVVNVDVRRDGSLAPLLRSTVMGGSMGVMGPFGAMMTLPTTHASAGAVMFRTISPKDGHIIEATVVRIRFGR